MKVKWIAFTLALGVASGATAADLKKGSTGFMKIPYSFFTSATNFWSSSRRYEATVQGGEHVSVNGEADWAAKGFPSLMEVTVKKTSFQREKGRTEVQLQGATGLDMRLYLVGQSVAAEGLFNAVVGSTDQKDRYAHDTYLALAHRFLGDSPLKDLEDERMVTLARFAHITASGTTLGTQVYKDNLYLVVDLGRHDYVLNDLKFNQAQRVAFVVTERLLTVLKAFGGLVSDTPVYGLALKLGVPHRAFTSSDGTEVEDIEIYSPNAEIAKFASADITSQALMDKSIVIAATNRIEVRLDQ